MMMNMFKKLFPSNIASYQKYLQQGFNIDPKAIPILLLQQLKNQESFKAFKKYMRSTEQNVMKVLRKLTVLHWTIFHQPELCDKFSQLSINIQSNDDWLNKNILKPYYQFICKIFTSYELFVKTKSKGVVCFQYELLCYIANLLKQLFKGVEKIASLARYYKKKQAQANYIVQNFVIMNACHAQELYNTFKIILKEIIRFPQVYIKNAEEKQFVKYLVHDKLIEINQNMKNLLLDKYFCPYHKGYGVSLLKAQELDVKSKQFIDQLLCKQKKEVKKKYSQSRQLQKLIFDEHGKVNPQLYESLRNIKLNESMRSIRYLNESLRSSRGQRDNSRLSQSQSFNARRLENQQMVQDI